MPWSKSEDGLPFRSGLGGDGKPWRIGNDFCADMKTEAVLIQTVEQLERMNEALAALRRELLPGQPKKFALLAEGPLEDMRRLQSEIEQLTAELTATPNGA